MVKSQLQNLKQNRLPLYPSPLVSCGIFLGQRGAALAATDANDEKFSFLGSSGFLPNGLSLSELKPEEFEPNGFESEAPPNGFESEEAPKGFDSCLLLSNRKSLALSSFSLASNWSFNSACCCCSASSILFGSLETPLITLTDPGFLLHKSSLQLNT
ncbi:hypothetical protein WICMUC_003742 [Wickerhamomyces mucosus]|uniref:Uncharacterized protein n=1 Tax=Wickerhamomyces mucosus TaxID=1378264 RepID=A0A9P8PJH0_9ASCO|nr:hypothetical protein WICMUC_003742 [Wickerhamomyces mucosus]